MDTQVDGYGTKHTTSHHYTPLNNLPTIAGMVLNRTPALYLVADSFRAPVRGTTSSAYTQNLTADQLEIAQFRRGLRPPNKPIECVVVRRPAIVHSVGLYPMGGNSHRTAYTSAMHRFRDGGTTNIMHRPPTIADDHVHTRLHRKMGRPVCSSDWSC